MGRNMKRLTLATFFFAALAMSVMAIPAFAKDATVGTCSANGAPTIQAAVTAASPGDHIKVCPGTYVEQVTIPAGKDNISLESTKPLQAIIQAPVVMLAPKAIV